MLENHDSILRGLYNQLKQRDPMDLESLHKICNLYEEYREAVSIASPEIYESNSVVTGKAISNICFDLMRHPNVISLSNSKSNLIKQGHLFFLGHRGGLCNRLRAIAALSAASTVIGFKFSFTWVETDSCRGAPLPWKNYANRLSPIIHEVARSQRNVLLEDNPLTAWQVFDKFRDFGLINSWPEFNEIYIQKSKQLLNLLLEKIDALIILENFEKDNKLKDYIAFHIRRTDFVPYFHEKYPDEKLPTLDDYILYAKKNCNSKNFFLSTDDFEVRSRFVNEFGNKVSFFDFEFDRSKLRQTSLKHSLLDLAMLSRGRELLLTPRSSFSDYAASISHAKVVAF